MSQTDDRAIYRQQSAGKISESLDRPILDLMHQHGYQATGVKEILHSANVPKGSFHHHFGSKEDFAAAALEKYTAREAEHFAAFNDSKTLPLKRLKRYFSDLV
ncbi:MAG TPA: TetR/AcrR family transcriptional regulator, partial [Terriglobales bacterium]